MEQVEDTAARILKALANLTATLNDDHLAVMKAESRAMWTLGAVVFVVDVLGTLMMTKLI
jgi:hypothetical protein